MRAVARKEPLAPPVNDDVLGMPDPVDLPEGTEAIVKLQRPPPQFGEDLSWVVFAQGFAHFRTYKSSQLPAWALDKRKLYAVARVSNGEWDFIKPVEEQTW